MKGQGMPHYPDHFEYGDLIISYKIKFPKSLTEQQKAGLNGLLQH